LGPGRWLAAILADTIDIVFFNIWGFPSIGYQRMDKLLDLYYLTFELIVVQRGLCSERSRHLLSTPIGWLRSLFELTA
jgi:hypothetical protein